MSKKSSAIIFSRHKKLYGIISLVVLGCFTQNAIAEAVFEPQVEYSISGTNPAGIILGDFNNDGIDDIATSLANGATSGSVSILFGTNGGEFVDHLQISITNGSGEGYVPAGLAGGDFNGDGRLDLAVTAGGSNLADVHVYLNTAAGDVSFSYSTTLVSGGVPAIAVVAEDLDKDGNLDLAVGNNVATTGAGVSVFIGSGDGTFSAAQNIVSTNAVEVTGIIAVDVDKDNDFDLVTPRLVLHNDGNGGFNVNNPLERQGTPLHIVSVDLNQDTWADIVLSGEGGMGTYTNDQSGIFSAVDRGFEDGPLRGHTAGDFNLDGNADVAFVREDTDDLRIFIGDGAGVLARDTPLIFSVGDEPQNIVSGDFNNDGMLDIAVSNRNAGSPTVSVLLQHDPNAPPNELPVANPGGPYNGTVDVAVQFDGSASSDPDGTIASYSWDFGNGTTGTGATPSATYTEAGTFNVTLTVTDDAGETNSVSTTVEIVAAANQPPVANPGGPYNGTVDVAVQFDGSASSDPDGTIASYSWDFGNGTTGTGATPSATYTEAGTFNVTLTVTDDAGETNSVSTTVEIVAAANQPPVANPGGPYNGTVDSAVQFDGSASSDPDGTIASYSWDFGNDTTGTGATPSATYTEVGTFNVTLTVTDDVGETSSVSTTVEIVAAANQPPVANPGGPYNGTVDVAVQFDGSASSDPDGTIASYNWDFGNGTTGTGATPTTIYTEAGTFNVTLTVTDDVGETSSVSTTVEIVAAANQPPVANPGGPYNGTVDVAVQFDGSASSDPDGTIASYNWDFGNGTTGTGATPSATYTEAGTFNVTLTVTDDVGETNSVSTTVVVVATANQPPVANPGGPYNGTVDSVVQFDGSASSDPDGTIASYNWDFGNGTTGTGATPSATYTEAGTFNVTLTVTDDVGETNSVSTTVVVVAAANQPPVANPGGPYNGIAGVAVQFNGSASSDPDGSIVSYNWDFGNGTTGTGATPTTIYTEAGTFNVTLTVTDDVGETNSVSITAVITAIAINQPPVANSGGPYNGIAGVAVQFDGSASSDPDGSIVSYNWDFGNGTTGTGATLTTTYNEVGMFDVTLTVTDDAGATNSVSTTVEIVAVDNQQPTANPGGPYKGFVDIIVVFNGFFSSDSDGKIVSYNWDFGDGGVGEGISPVYIYTEEGTYDVTLTVTDDTGATNTASTTINVVKGGAGAFGSFTGLGLALMIMMKLRARRNSNDNYDGDGDIDH